MPQGKVSKWYTSNSAENGHVEEIEKWYAKIIEHDYRGISVEAPSKMILALGILAKKEGVSFQDFIEKILADFLKEKKYDWES